MLKHHVIFSVCMTKIKKVGVRNFNRSLELFINRRSALERILECLQMTLLVKGKERESFCTILALWSSAHAYFYKSSHWVLLLIVHLPQTDEMAGTMGEPHQDFTWQAGFYRERKSAFCQTSFFKLLFWKLQFYIKEVCCCQCTSLGI